MERIWRCTVCRYLHNGEQPPDNCPVCHVDASKFELVVESADEAAGPPPVGIVREMVDALVPHAIAAHFPNALLPTLLLFLGLFLLTGKESFETAAFYLLVVSVLAVPPTIATGLYDWRKKFAGQSAPIFRKKMVLAGLLMGFVLLAVAWRWQDPALLIDGGWPAWLFIVLLAAMLGCVTLLGHYGGLLVFAKHKQK